jgi:hypothetical protein
MNVVPLEPRTLARSRQPDRQNHRSLAGARGSRHSLTWRLPRDNGFRDGAFYCGCFRCGRSNGGMFCGDCGCCRSRSRPRTTSATTSAAATTARRSWSRFTRRGRRGCSRDRCSCRHWLRFRGAAGRFNHRSRYWSCGRRVRLIIVKPRLQRLGRVSRLFGGAFPGLLAALQALGHPFAHIAACSTPTHTGAIRAPWRPGYPGTTGLRD